MTWLTVATHLLAFALGALALLLWLMTACDEQAVPTRHKIDNTFQWAEGPGPHTTLPPPPEKQP